MLTAPHILYGHTEGHGMQLRHRRQGRQACWGFAAELTDIKRAQTRFKDFWR
jgi:hypothetical protein